MSIGLELGGSFFDLQVEGVLSMLSVHLVNGGIDFVIKLKSVHEKYCQLDRKYISEIIYEYLSYILLV